MNPDHKFLSGRKCWFLRSYIAMGLALVLADIRTAVAVPLPSPSGQIGEEQASQLSKLALEGLDRQYPNKPAHVLTGASSLVSPKEMHPAFFGCFDWHSSVHGHWMLVRLLKQYPKHFRSVEAKKVLQEHLTREKMEVEAAYFDEKENRSFERMYGWAWLLRLVAELDSWDDPSARIWRKNLEPLEAKIVELTQAYLPRLSNPIRTGVHPDTAFALSQMIDYARTTKQVTFEQQLIEASLRYYRNDRNYAEHFEPSGEDFFSPSLNEADLMRRVLGPKEFANWLEQYLPNLGKESSNLLRPVAVTDVTDGKLVHLAGLDFSRAWTLSGIASALSEDDGKRALLLASAKKHIDVGMQYVFSGKYEGEHWLGTFAVYALTGVGLDPPVVSASIVAKPSDLRSYETKPSDARFDKFNPRKAPEEFPPILKRGDRLAIVGDSITEQKMYSRIIENYLTMCMPELEVSVRQFGWSGERTDGFLKRMERDCLTFHPTVATICYGMNDSRYRPFDDINGDLFREQSLEILHRFKRAGARPILGSPGCAGKIATWVKTRVGTLDEHNIHLCTLRDIALETAIEEHVPFADIFWPMYQAQILAPDKYSGEGKKPYEVAGKDGIHPGWAGQVIMAYAFLQAMGLDGNLAEFRYDVATQKMTISAGHEILSQQEGGITLRSHRYPFCASGAIDQDDSIRSGMTLVPFQQRLNRWTLKLVGASQPRYRVTWGTQSRVYSKEELSAGVNIAEDFPENPFSESFARVDQAVLAKQTYETKQIKQTFHSSEAKTNFEAVLERTEKERAPLVEAIQKAFVPIEHSLRWEAVP